MQCLLLFIEMWITYEKRFLHCLDVLSLTFDKFINKSFKIECAIAGRNIQALIRIQVNWNILLKFCVTTFLHLRVSFHFCVVPFLFHSAIQPLYVSIHIHHLIPAILKKSDAFGLNRINKLGLIHCLRDWEKADYI